MILFFILLMSSVTSFVYTEPSWDKPPWLWCIIFLRTAFEIVGHTYDPKCHMYDEIFVTDFFKFRLLFAENHLYIFNQST